MTTIITIGKTEDKYMVTNETKTDLVIQIMTSSQETTKIKCKARGMAYVPEFDILGNRYIMNKKVKPFALVSANHLETPEQFMMHLLTAIISLNTLESFQEEAFKKGFMKESEMQKSEFIRYDLHKLLATYSDLFTHLGERFQFDTTEIISQFQAATRAQAEELLKEKK